MSELDAANARYDAAQGQMRFLPNYYGWMYRSALPFIGGTVVELGSGAGHGIEHYLDRVDHVVAVDYNQDLLDVVAKRWPASRVTPVRVDLRHDWDALSDVRARTVLMMDLLEHFEADFDMVRRAKRLLQPGGHLVIKVPAQRRLYSRMDVASGHYRRYEDSDLSNLMAEAGLELVSLRHVNCAGALAYRLKGDRPNTNFSRTFRPWQLQLINALIPVVSLLDAIPGAKGLSILGVCRN